MYAAVAFHSHTSPDTVLLQGLVIPEALRPYMQGRDFIPYTKELPLKRK